MLLEQHIYCRRVLENLTFSQSLWMSDTVILVPTFIFLYWMFSQETRPWRGDSGEQKDSLYCSDCNWTDFLCCVCSDCCHAEDDTQNRWNTYGKKYFFSFFFQLLMLPEAFLVVLLLSTRLCLNASLLCAFGRAYETFCQLFFLCFSFRLISHRHVHRFLNFNGAFSFLTLQ